MPPPTQQHKLQQPSSKRQPQTLDRRTQKRLTWQTLPKSILTRIFSFHVTAGQTTGSGSSGRFRSILELSQLNRGVRAVLRPHLFERLFFERVNLAMYDADGKLMSSNDQLAAKKLPPEPRWRSNLKLVREANMSGCVATVAIATADRYPDPKDVLAMLKDHGFDKLKYPSVTRLLVSYKADFEIDDRPDAEWFADESYTALAQYLSQNLAHVHELIFDDHRCSRAGLRNALSPYISSNLAQLRRLQLSFSYMPTFGVKTLPPQLTYLRLTVFSAYSFINIPRISTQALQVLSLSSVPIEYLWQRFVNTAPSSDGSGQQPGVIEFPELRKLEVTFHVPYRSIPMAKTESDYAWENSAENTGTQPESFKGNPKLKAMSVPDPSPKYHVLRTDGRRPLFPKLTSLTLNQYPGRVSEFLKDVPVGQLVVMRITGDIGAFKGLRLRGFTSLQRCSLILFSELKHRQAVHADRFLALAMGLQAPALQLLHVVSSSQCRVRAPPVDRTLCATVRRLHLSISLCFEDLPDLLRCLPLLERLDLERTLLVQPPPEARTPEGLADVLLAGGLEPISTSLLVFSPDVLCRGGTEEALFYNLVGVIARVPSLRRLNMYSFYSKHFYECLRPLLNVPRLSPFVRHLAELEFGEATRMVFF